MVTAPTGRPSLKPGDKVRLQESFPTKKLRGVIGTAVRITGHVVAVELTSGVRLMCMDHHVEKVSPSSDL